MARIEFQKCKIFVRNCVAFERKMVAALPEAVGCVMSQRGLHLPAPYWATASAARVSSLAESMLTLMHWSAAAWVPFRQSYWFARLFKGEHQPLAKGRSYFFQLAYIGGVMWIFKALRR